MSAAFLTATKYGKKDTRVRASPSAQAEVWVAAESVSQRGRQGRSCRSEQAAATEQGAGTQAQDQKSCATGGPPMNSDVKGIVRSRLSVYALMCDRWASD